jgi:hypothetical protein
LRSRGRSGSMTAHNSSVTRGFMPLTTIHR